MSPHIVSASRTSRRLRGTRLAVCCSALLAIGVVAGPSRAAGLDPQTASPRVGRPVGSPVEVARRPVPVDPSSAEGLAAGAAALGVSVDSTTYLRLSVAGTTVSVVATADGEEAKSGTIGFASLAGEGVPAGQYRLRWVVRLPGGGTGPYDPVSKQGGAALRKAPEDLEIGLVGADGRVVASAPLAAAVRPSEPTDVSWRDSKPRPKVDWEKVLDKVIVIAEAVIKIIKLFK